MNCDQAFETLTSPAGRDDDALQSHLAGCPRCRDVADMLGVALDLFDESYAVNPVENRNANPPDERLSNRSNRLPATASAPWLQQTRRLALRRDGSRIATFLILVAVFSVGIVRLGQGDSASRELVSVSLPESCLRDTRAPENTTDEKNSRTASGTVIAVCVACHLDADTSASLPPVQRGHAVQFVQNCVACHFEMTTAPPETSTALVDSAQLNAGRRVCLF